MPKSTMTVGELKEELNQYSDDAPVYFTYNYGDHCHTEVAQGITSIEEGAIKYSDYHQMDIVDVMRVSSPGNALLLSNQYGDEGDEEFD